MTAKSKLAMVINRARQIGRMFPEFFSQGDTKRLAPYKDYGFPEHPTFYDYYEQYRRNGYARAGVQRAIEKCWQDIPWLLESEDVHHETTAERQVADMLERTQFWSKLKEADEKSRVGEYAGIILRFADDKLHNQPVDRVPGGLDGLVEIIPVYQAQLKPSDWITDERSPDYGKVKMYQFQESAVWEGEDAHRMARSFDVHPDRVHIWSRDGSVFGESVLMAGLNDLITLQKIIGAGGEGFWKNAKSSPHLQIDPETSMQSLAESLGVSTVDEVADAIGDQIDDWQRGFDNMLLTKGIESKSMNVTLPDPEQFIAGPLQSFTASVNTPLKILVGNQTGERASTEDQNDWNQTNAARRIGYIIPNIRRLVDRLVRVKVLPDVDWFVDWSDLTESSLEAKVGRVSKMAEINQKMLGRDVVFTSTELREVIGMEPLEGELIDEIDDEDEQPAVNKRNGRIIVNVRRGK
jgi:hypothetical protein